MSLISNTVNLTDFDFDTELQLDSRPSSALVFNDDPVVLSCASYRLWKSTGRRWVEFRNLDVSEEDRTLADLLKRYYRERTHNILFDVLRNGGNKVSEFRKKLTLIAHNQYENYTKQDLGLLYKLPYFYHEDIALDKIFQLDNYRDQKYYFNRDQQPLTLTPVERIFRSRKHGEAIQFWFISQQEPGIYQWTVQTGNPLLSLVEGLFELPQIKIDARVSASKILGRGNSVYGSIVNARLSQL